MKEYLKAGSIKEIAAQVSPVYKELKKNAKYSKCPACYDRGQFGNDYLMVECAVCDNKLRVPGSKDTKQMDRLLITFNRLKQYAVLDVKINQNNMYLVQINKILNRLDDKYSELLP